MTALRMEIEELHKEAEILRVSREQAIGLIEAARADLLGLNHRNHNHG